MPAVEIEIDFACGQRNVPSQRQRPIIAPLLLGRTRPQGLTVTFITRILENYLAMSLTDGYVLNPRTILE